MGDTHPRPADVTRLLEAWSGGRRDVLDQLLPVVYAELRKMARGQLARARRQHTFQPTELVHEAFVRLVDQRAAFQNRVHFYGIAATCMRRVLADYARRRKALKRPQIDRAVDVDRIERAGGGQIDRLIAIDEALDRIQQTAPRQARIAELRMFTDLEIAEIGTVVGVSPATVKREWAEAKVALQSLLGGAS